MQCWHSLGPLAKNSCSETFKINEHSQNVGKILEELTLNLLNNEPSRHIVFCKTFKINYRDTRTI